MKNDIKRKIAKRELQVNEKEGRVLVSIQLRPRVGRERTVRITTEMVRNWLKEEEGLDIGTLISGTGIHNNMSRRLGTRTAEDLQTDFVFELNLKAPPPPKAKETPKPKVKAKPKVVSKPPVEVEVAKREKVEEQPVPEVKVGAKRVTKVKSTRTRSTRVKKVDK